MTARRKAAAVKEPVEEAVEGTATEIPDLVVPAPAELVIRPDVEGDEFRVMDAYDELQILDNLQGRPSEKLVYSFKGKDGKMQTGLSYEGVAEVVREMNANRMTRIRVSPDFTPVFETVQEENEHGTLITYVQAMVYAEDLLNGGGDFGTARQPKFQVFRDANKTPKLDGFATAKALSKAQRNAMKPLTPVVFREALIAQMLGNPTRVQLLRTGMGDPVAELPAPLVDERATELKEQIRAVYAQIKAIDVQALLPGQFNAKLRRVEHEHAGLEELLEALQSQLIHLQTTNNDDTRTAA